MLFKYVFFLIKLKEVGYFCLLKKDNAKVTVHLYNLNKEFLKLFKITPNY